jgi:SpoVK/Ycf46/Vps4 family AAA+-type ATPase
MPLTRRRPRRIRPATSKNHPGQTLAAQWILKILIDMNAIDELFSNMHSFARNSEAVRAIGIEGLDDRHLETHEVMEKLQHRQQQLADQQADFGPIMEQNLAALAEAIGLSQEERLVLGGIMLCLTHRGLAETTDLLGDLSNEGAKNLIADLLDLSPARVRRIFSFDGLLMRAGLMRFDSRTAMPFQHKLEPMEGLVELLNEPHANVLDMLRGYFQPAKPPSLDPDDFDYLGRQYHILRQYLDQAARQQSSGVNILIHGRPGTGKTELARILARELSLQLFEIGMADNEGDAIHGDRRFSAYQLSQQILARQSRALILFDEIEDVFHEPFLPFFGVVRRGDRRKAWTNRLLEENPVPAIWISNDIRQIDDAFIRRFDMVLPLETPPRRTRQRILKRNLQTLAVSDQWIGQMAEHPEIAPALVERAARVVASVASDQDGEAQQRDLQQLLGNTLKAMGARQRPLTTTGPLTRYRRDILNTDRDLDSLVDGLARHNQGRLCLYGPPGTGKTEFGRHLAEQLDKPLLLRRASDLLGPFVGMTEQRIAQMFEQAASDDALLLLDEADSFLRDRTGAHRGWEVTQVNELLTQMEAFEGIFVCSTNLMDALDAAALRRFDLKIRFDPLRPPQALELFRQTLSDQGQNAPPDPAWQTRLARLDNLTPGDFHAVLRARRLAPEPITPESLLLGLEKECNIKAVHGGRGIGFMAEMGT